MRRAAPLLVGLLVCASCELLLPDLKKVADGGGQGATGDACDVPEDCESGNCQNGLCCAAGGTCCDSDAVCSDNLACNLAAFECYTECGPGGEDFDYACAEGYHCDANVCFEDIVLGDCDESSDCVSQECISGHCCQHAGLCCAEDVDCPDLFDGCADDDSQTCVFSAFAIPDTGQASCFDVNGDATDCGDITSGNDYYGQDGHTSGQQPSFSDLGDETVEDANSGLIWTRADGGQMTFSNALMYCQDLTLCGHSWRLPLRYELQHLVIHEPGTTVGLDPAFDVAPGAGDFWTGTDLAGAETSTSWTVDLEAGTAKRTGKDSSQPRVLCVVE